MSDRYGSYPPDEPVIGASYPPPPSAPPTGGYPADPGAEYYDEEDEYDEGYAYAEDEDGYGDYDDDYYDDGYYEETPARQPMFYVFIGLSALVGAVVVFLLFSLVAGKAGGGDSPTPAAQFKVLIDSPAPNDRVDIGKQFEVNVRATSTEAITKFELFASDRMVDTVNVTSAPADGKTYATTLKTQFDQKGEYKIFVRVTSSSGTHKDSDKQTVIAVQPVGDKPLVIKGKVIATVNVRKSPAENGDLVKTLDAGQEVNIVGKTRDNEWLLIDLEGGSWVKRTAIDPQDSLALVPFKDPTPVPLPTATNTVEPSPSPSATPTTNPNAPDFAPTGAALSDGGAKLTITVANLGNGAYHGPLVASVSGDVTGELVVEANMAANGGVATFVFDVSPPITTQGKKVTVSVDPKNSIKESREDNNGATFVLQPPVEQPRLQMVVEEKGSNLSVLISNTGGALAAPSAEIRVTLGNDRYSRTESLAINKGGSQTVTLPRPQGTGQATVEIIVSGSVLASGTVQLQ